MSEHGIGGLVLRSPPGCDLVVRFLLSGQPLRGEEPGLVGRDGHEAADGDRPVIMQGELDLIALADVQRAPDVVGQRQLRLGAHPRPGPDAGLRLGLSGISSLDVGSRRGRLRGIAFPRPEGVTARKGALMGRQRSTTTTPPRRRNPAALSRPSTRSFTPATARHGRSSPASSPPSLLVDSQHRAASHARCAGSRNPSSPATQWTGQCASPRPSRPRPRQAFTVGQSRAQRRSREPLPGGWKPQR